MSQVIGKIIKIRGSNGGWASVMVEDDAGDIINCVGSIPGAVEGMRIKAEGEYDQHPKFGRQFSVTQSELEVDYTKEYAERYLKSGAIKGIGLETAKKIIDKFGADTMRIIETDEYVRLAEVDGIGSKTAKKIHDAYNENNAYRKLLGYANLSLNKADKLYRKYEDKALDMIKNKPYQIIYDIEGFGFKTVDEIALKNGWPIDHPDRIAAAITYQLYKIGDDGHCCCTIDALEANLNQIIPDVNNEIRSDVLLEEIRRGNIIVEDGNIVYSKRLFEAENHIARNIAKMLFENEGEVPQRMIDNAIASMEDEVGFELEVLQKQAVSMALRNRLCIITGGPGTGKSTIVKAIVKGWLSVFPLDDDPLDHILLCAPTGKASRRLSEVTGIFAETVQRILVRQKSEEAEAIEGKMIIVDESSMLDINLANAIIRIAERGNNRIIFIGDVDQLPPIGPGSFFRDLVSSPCVPSVTLTLCHRQTGTIAINAKRINDGNAFPSLNFQHESCRFVYAEKENARDAVLNEYRNLLNQYDIRDICIIVPTRKSGRSHTAAEDLNLIIRDEVNPILDGDIQIEGFPFREGDRVMCTANDYAKEIFNGDCGIIQELDPVFKRVYIDMDDGRVVELALAQAMTFTLAYAITCHKVQGSEFKSAIIAHNIEHSFMLQRNLLYTAITRAKEKVVIVGEPAAINLAIKKIPSIERMTRLKKRISQHLY